MQLILHLLHHIIQWFHYSNILWTPKYFVLFTFLKEKYPCFPNWWRFFSNIFVKMWKIPPYFLQFSSKSQNSFQWCAVLPLWDIHYPLNFNHFITLCLPFKAILKHSEIFIILFNFNHFITLCLPLKAILKHLSMLINGFLLENTLQSINALNKYWLIEKLKESKTTFRLPLIPIH